MLVVSVVLPLLVTVPNVKVAAAPVRESCRLTWTSEPALVFVSVGASDTAIVSVIETSTGGLNAGPSATVTLSTTAICAGGTTATLSETATFSVTVRTAAASTAGASVTVICSLTVTTITDGCTVKLTA